LNDDSEHLLDGSAGGFLCSFHQINEEVISLNEYQYYLPEAKQQERGIHVLDDKNVKGAKDSLKNHIILVAEIQNFT
jgi:hypothetical protein